MRSPLIQRQTIEYTENEPFILQKVIKNGVNRIYQKNSHWHDDLELIYLLRGKARFFIDGEYLDAGPRQLVVINCESVHRVFLETDSIADPSAIAVLDLLIPRNFLDQQFPEHKAIRFVEHSAAADDKIRDILFRFSEYTPSPSRPFERLYVHGLLLQLLYLLCQRGFVSRTEGFSRHDSLIRLKDILQYVDEHYHEPLTQAAIAARFYFTPQYFSRFFKQCTGMTFSEHLTGRRIHGARQDLLHTDKRITEIAFDNGFADERSFINAFKKLYQVTPTQYRKTILANLP